jgi:TatD DNase family protein
MLDFRFMSARWIDSHAHLTMFEEHELPGVLERAAAAGVDGVLVPATAPDDLQLTLSLAASFPDRIVTAIGVHPHDARLLDNRAKDALQRALARPGVVAIGEIGLDYHYMNSPREDQLAALRWQLELALEAGLPVVLHNRESWSDLAAVLSEHAGSLRGVCHSFTEGPEAARQVLDWGLMVGISGMVTFKAADNIREMAAVLRADQVLVETDSPYLAPVPYRGRRNEPAFVVEVGTRLAEVLGVSAEGLAEATSRSFRDLFAVPAAWPRSAAT